MIHGLKQFTRLLKISAILSRYRLDEFLEATHLYRPMSLLRLFTPGGKELAEKPRGERLRMARTNWPCCRTRSRPSPAKRPGR